ncbi:Sigma-70 region 2 [Lentzea waywayandensis]|uniref:Sigma-70 region 2 n=1 Tax=Lentzea waywayandensis TaxID=84724 RepID=A0A1I6DE81_9PSEU|nr:sigma factor [Lentzea waywayandensis]SFR03612.1 Sigma-70 region 2 [Lentzea waywayandensis]
MSSDAELIDRSLRGDTSAFVEVISRHETAMGNYLARRVGRQAAEDVLGDVWAAAYESRATYDRSYPEARPWLYGVALNRLRRHWRSEPAVEPALDLSRLASDWDLWPAVDVRADTQRCCAVRWPG